MQTEQPQNQEEHQDCVETVDQQVLQLEPEGVGADQVPVQGETEHGHRPPDRPLTESDRGGQQRVGGEIANLDRAIAGDVGDAVEEDVAVDAGPGNGDGGNDKEKQHANTVDNGWHGESIIQEKKGPTGPLV